MAKPKLYGISTSRALRSIWAMEEVGIDYEHVQTSFRGDTKAAEYLEVNPNGRVPALVDGDLKLFESMAINLYLTKTYGGSLYPQDAQAEARTWQWSVWGISEIEPLQLQLVIQRVFTPEEKRDAGVIERAAKGLLRPLKVLDASLAGRDWLIGENFSVADLNLAAVMLLLGVAELDYSAFANVQRWAQACYSRPALARAQSK